MTGVLTTPNTKEKGKHLDQLSKHIRRGYATLGLIADELMAEGVTVSGDKDINVPTKWISVKDRLPKEHRLVLCRWPRGIGASYGLARYNHDNDVWYVSNEGFPEVTHWMPLPQPPKGE